MRMTLAEMNACVEKIQDHGSSVTIAQRDDLISEMFQMMQNISDVLVASLDGEIDFCLEEEVGKIMGVELFEKITEEEYKQMMTELCE